MRFYHISVVSLSVWAYGFFCKGFVAFIVHFLGAYYSFIGVHDASHRIVSAWFGRVCAIPLCIPFDEFAILHRCHHAHVNDPDLDPDFRMQELHPLCWVFAPEIYLQYHMVARVELGVFERMKGALGYGVITLVHCTLLYAFGARWVACHMIGPSRCALCLLVYLLDVLPHRNLGKGRTRNLWTERRAPRWLECLTQNQCYHEQHHAKPYIRTTDL